MMDWDKLSNVHGHTYNKHVKAKWTGKEFAAIMANKRKMSRRLTAGERRFREVFKSLGLKYILEKQRIFIETKSKTDKKAYIADFYLPEIKLVFEIDGTSHNSEHAKLYDLARSSFLATRKITVFRLTNDQTKEPTLCKELILKAIRERREHAFAVSRNHRTTQRPKDRSPERQQAIDEFIAAKGCTILPEITKRRKFKS